MPTIYRTSVDCVNRISVRPTCQKFCMGDSNDRLRHAREMAGFDSAMSAAKRFNWKPSTYASHENGQSKVPQEAAVTYAKKFGTTPGWILTGEGKPPKNKSGRHIDSEDILPQDRAPARRNVISTVHPYEAEIPNAMPVVSSALSAGPGQASPETVATHKGGITYSAEAVLGEISLPASISSSLSAAPTNRIHWFEVRGDSMEPTLGGGDWVGVNTLDTAIGQGGVFALLDSNGEILVKRLRRLRGEDSAKVQIVSDNPRQGVDVEDLESITIFGRIVARISRVG